MGHRKLFAVAVMVTSGCLLAGVASAQSNNTLTPKEKKNRWQLLFNGKNLDGWHSYLQKKPGKDWSVRNGAIVLNKPANSQRKDYADLVTNAEFKNFDFKVQWKMKPCVDSGIMFYVHEATRYKATYETAPEMQIADLACTKPDSRVLKERAGDIFDLIPLHMEWVKKAGHWNQYEIIADNGHVELFQNGHKVLDTHLGDAHWKKLVANSKFDAMPNFGTFRTGHISLQGTEDKGKSHLKIRFRNIKIKKLKG